MSTNKLQIKNLDGSKIKVAIVVSSFNQDLVEELCTNTVAALLQLKVKKANIKIVHAPGAMELPLLAKKIALQKKHNVIIALGAVIKGKTAHFEHVCRVATDGCLQVSLATMTPIINGILTVNNLKQAKERVSHKKLNKGREFAESAIMMTAI